MEALIPNQPTSAIPAYSKSQKRHMRTERKQNKIEFNPDDMRRYENDAHKRKKDLSLKRRGQIKEAEEEQKREKRHEKTAYVRDVEQRGMQVLKQLKSAKQMTVEEIKERLKRLETE